MLLCNYTKEEFIEFLTSTVIPDLEESGRIETATDFKLAVALLQGAKEVEVYSNGTIVSIS